MKNIATFLVILGISNLVSLSVALANFDFASDTHPAPVSFTVDASGEAYGKLEGGYTFTQKNIFLKNDIKIQKFVTGVNFFYISDKGIIEAENDLRAISIYFSLV